MSWFFDLDSFEQFCFDLASELLMADQPIPEFSTRLEGRLEACLGAPKQTFEGQYLYPGVVEQGAALFYLLNKNHAFLNGNKRIALVALLVFLWMNGKDLRAEPIELEEFTKEVAGSDPRKSQETQSRICDFIRERLEDVPPNSS